MHRRTLIVRAAAFAAVASPSAFRAQTDQWSANAPNEDWLKDLHGKHKQFFDTNALNNGAPLTRVANFLDVYRDSYGLTDRDVNAIVGAHGTGLGLVLSDAMWERYELGAYYSLNDPPTGQAARRNLYSGSVGGGVGAVNSVAALQLRGVRFLGCQQSINRVARELSAKGKGVEAEIRKEFAGGLLPGVTLVPAMVVAANRAQESGVAYLFVG
jgi:intracellular sulfur oxidation DsrE/DsrF family protein